MILHNTTFCIDEPFEKKLVDFVKETYMPAAYDCGMYNGLLTKIRAPRETNGLNGQSTVNYAIQFRAPSDEICRRFSDEIMPAIFSGMNRDLQQALHVYCTALDVIYDAEKNGD